MHVADPTRLSPIPTSLHLDKAPTRHPRQKESSPLSVVPDTDPELYSESASKEELKGLIKGLREYAGLLEWKIGRDDEVHRVETSK